MRQTVEELSYDDAGGAYWRIAGTLHGAAGSALAVPYRLTFTVDGPSRGAFGLHDERVVPGLHADPQSIKPIHVRQRPTQRASCASS